MYFQFPPSWDPPEELRDTPSHYATRSAASTGAKKRWGQCMGFREQACTRLASDIE